MKKAYLWVHFWARDCGSYKRLDVKADLVFSSPETFKELAADFDDVPYSQLVEIYVPEEFDNWDYVPDNY